MTSPNLEEKPPLSRVEPPKSEEETGEKAERLSYTEYLEVSGMVTRRVNKLTRQLQAGEVGCGTKKLSQKYAIKIACLVYYQNLRDKLTRIQKQLTDEQQHP